MAAKTPPSISDTQRAREGSLSLIRGASPDPLAPPIRRLSEWVNLSQRILDGTTVDLKPYTTRVRRVLEGPSIHKDINAQVWAIRYVREFADMLPGNEGAALAGAACTAFNIDPVRLEYLISLTRDRDLRTALKAKYVEPGPRLAHESVYPTTGWIGAYLEYSQETPVPMGYDFWTAVGMLGAAARRNLYCNEEGFYFIYPNHYTIMVGPSAIGKSTALKTVGQPILERANDIVDRLIYDRLSGTLPNMAHLPDDRTINVLTSKVTDAKLMQELALATRNIELERDKIVTVKSRQSIGYLANDELVTLFGKKTHAPENIIALLTDFYNCQDKPSGRGAVTQEYGKLADLCLTFMGGTTLEWLNRSITEDAFAGGFMSRVMYVHRPDDHDERYYARGAPPLDPARREQLARLLVPWMLLPCEMEMELTDAAADRFYIPFKRETHNLIRHPKDMRMVPYYKRRVPHLLKLAMVLTMSNALHGRTEEPTEIDLEREGSWPIDADALDQAITILQHEEQFLPACFSRVGQHAEDKAVEDIMAQVRKLNERTGEPVSVGTIRTWARRTHGAKGAKALVDDMMETGVVQWRMSENTKGPKTKELWAVDVLGESGEDPLGEGAEGAEPRV